MDLRRGHMVKLTQRKKGGVCTYPWLSYCSLVATHTHTVSMGTPARTGPGQGCGITTGLWAPSFHPLSLQTYVRARPEALEVAGGVLQVLEWDGGH